MSNEKRKILEMLAQGNITVEESERLLSALDNDARSSDADGEQTGTPTYLRVLVEPDPDDKDGDRVNIRVPINLIKAGLKFTAFIPGHARESVDGALKEQGIDVDLNKITAEDLEELIKHLNDLEVEVDGKEKVRIYCE